MQVIGRLIIEHRNIGLNQLAGTDRRKGKLLDFLKDEEKKVEYVELIYDLIFVYIIGRNNSLVSHITDGFIDPEMYLTYVLCTLITIQIWYITILFINRYGSNDFSEYIGLFINMFLIYYMADSTRVHWESYFYRYNIAWALILLNLLIQYLLKYRETMRETPWETANIMLFIRMLAVMIIMLAAGIALYRPLGIPLTPLAMVAGIIMSIVGRKKMDLVSVDFGHLTERVMLYVVFTFGEMIIAISVYFEGDFNLSSFYYAACAFMIVVGLFMSYGFLYDRLLDREMSISGNTYMLIHIAIIFALSNLTMAFEFMREPEISAVPKNIYLVASFAVYYIFVFALAPFTKGYTGKLKYFRSFGITLPVFVVLSLACVNHPGISIAISAIMSFWVWYLEYKYWKVVIQPIEE